MVVQLDEDEFLSAVVHARIRQGVKSVNLKSGEIRNRRYCDRSDFEIDLAGALGEVAVEGFLVGSTRDTALYKAGDTGVDIQYRGASIQVKTRLEDYAEPHAYVNSLSEFRADWIVQCHLRSLTTVRIVGFIGRDEFAELCFDRDFGYGNRKCVKESSLYPIERLDGSIATGKPTMAPLDKQIEEWLA